MECPHINDSVSLFSESLLHRINLKCSDCKTEKSPWICLKCGVVNCGRYVNGHAKAHYESKLPLHSICIDCDNWSVFCYTCDEFVINDTDEGTIDSNRKKLQEHVFNNSKENKKQKRRRSSDSEENDKNKKQKENDTKKKKPKAKASGLRNLGNTCFMNAVLQSLSNIQGFCSYIKQLPSFESHVSKKKYSTRSCKDGDNVFVVEELRKTLVSLYQSQGKGAISPDALFSVIWKVVPRFRGYQQQDAHEFMRYLLDRLHTELLTLLPYPNTDSAFIGPKSKSTIVTYIFGGILQSEVTCLVCGCNSKKHDPFLDISLDIPSRFTAKTPEPKNNEEVCEITDCLASFTELEELEESELYMCNQCKEKQKSTKKFWIKNLPNVLCLHLKRFRWSTFFRTKVDTYVNFPIKQLDVNNFVLKSHSTRNSGTVNSVYDLAACVVHHGSGAGSGHYTSYATKEGQWYHFNDSNVSVCDEDQVKKCKAYILFYVKRDANIVLPENLRITNPSNSCYS